MVCFPGEEEQLHQEAELPTKGFTILTTFSTELWKMLDLDTVFPFRKKVKRYLSKAAADNHATESPCHKPKSKAVYSKPRRQKHWRWNYLCGLLWHQVQGRQNVVLRPTTTAKDASHTTRESMFSLWKSVSEISCSLEDS